MAVGRISGQLLKSNLLRQGQNLAFETNLLYIDVNNNRVGIKTATPQYPLDVNGTARTTNLEATGQVTVGNITISGNSITTTANQLNLSAPDGILYNNNLQVDDLIISGNTIRATDSNQNFEIVTSGTGTVDIYGDTRVNGNIHATGNIRTDGNITIGDQDTDSLTINADVASNLIPDVSNTYNLGSATKRWNNAYANNLTVDNLTLSGNITVQGLNLTARPGKVIYVATNGSDSNSGTHQNDPYATIEQALSVCVAGDHVHVYPGTYTEAFPLTMPTGVSLRGDGLRAVTIQPTGSTNTKDAFILNGEVTIEDITITGFYYNSSANEGHAFRFNPTGNDDSTGYQVTSRSPYIRNITVITQGSTTTAADPRGFLSGDAGRGAFFDGELATPNSNEASCLFQNATFITPGVDAITLTNGVRIEWLNSFTYFALSSINAYDGTLGLKGAGQTALKVGGFSGTPLAQGQVLTYYDTQGNQLASGTIAAVDGDKIFINGKSLGFQLPAEQNGKTIQAIGDAKLNTTTKKFGSASLQLDGVGDAAKINTNADFGFGTGDFTIDFWAYPNAVQTTSLIDMRNNVSVENALYFYVENNVPKVYVNGSVIITGSQGFNLSVWTHCEIVRSSGTITVYINGSSVGSASASADFANAKPFVIGNNFGNTNGWNGYIDALRVYKGQALHTGNFTAPTTEAVGNANTKLVANFNGNNASTTFLDTNLIAQDIRTSAGATATSFTLVDYTDFGAEVRSIASASIYGRFGVKGDGVGVKMYLISHNFAYIGNDYEVDNDAATVIQANEVVANNGAKIFFSSVDHRGDFRVGDQFSVNQQTGEVSFTSADLNIDVDSTLTFTTGSDVTTISGNEIQSGNVKISGNTITTTSGNLNLDSFTDTVAFSDNVNITGNLDVGGDITIGGNVTIGDQTTDNITISAGIASDLIPATNNLYNIGSSTKNWNKLFANEAIVDSVRITGNKIESIDTNADLDLRTSGTGSVTLENFTASGDTITNTSGDFIINPASSVFKVAGTGSIRIPSGNTAQRPASPVAGMMRYNTQTNVFEGYNGSNWIALTGVYDLDQDTYITAELTPGNDDDTIRFYAANTLVANVNSSRFDVTKLVVDNIEISGNTLTTTGVDQDLILNANGNGSIRIEDFRFQGNTITNIISAPLKLKTTGTGYIDVSDAGGFVIPVGSTVDRPVTGLLGMIRYNTNDERVELYDGVQWGSIAGSSGAVSIIDATEIAVQMAVTLG